jgi:uncharacterized membrane protein
MSILRGFMPFILFGVLTGPLGAGCALQLAALLAILMAARDGARKGWASLKLLEAASAVLFAGLAVAAAIASAGISLFVLKLCVDAGLAVIAIGSMLVGRPFTIQYAREQVAPEFWHSPIFIRTNYRITAVWAAAFVVQAFFSAAGAFIPGLPPALPLALVIAAFVGAVLFTVEYPKRVRARVRAGAT